MIWVLIYLVARAVLFGLGVAIMAFFAIVYLAMQLLGGLLEWLSSPRTWQPRRPIPARERRPPPRVTSTQPRNARLFYSDRR